MISRTSAEAASTIIRMELRQQVAGLKSFATDETLSPEERAWYAEVADHVANAVVVIETCEDS